jgi:hypothetical protein
MHPYSNAVVNVPLVTDVSRLVGAIASIHVGVLGQQVVASRLTAPLIEVNKKGVLEELGEYLSQRLKIVEAMLQNLVNDFPIYVQVIVNQHVAKANNLDPPVS